MVTANIPPHYTGSPSSFGATPQLTIHKDVAEDLDSSTAFEGPEKLLEVWFSPSATGLAASARPNGLKAVSGDTWRDMLDLVNCKVLSVIESDQMDAYLLSESSMFVFPHKLVLKTCGTTTLLLGLPRMLEIAASEAGFPTTSPAVPNSASPYRVFYSRKNFLFPDRQRGPHRSWRDEVTYLDKLFLGGSAYMIGKMNGEHWYLYITGPDTELTPPSTPQTEHFPADLPTREEVIEAREIDAANDETLEILMTDLDEENARQFYLEDAARIAENGSQRRAHATQKSAMDHSGSNGTSSEPFQNGNSDFDVFAQTSTDHSGLNNGFPPEALTTEGHTLGTVVSDASGLASLYPKSKYPDARIDAYLFTPCGFSANGVVPCPTSSGSMHYFTVHVTPEPVCSYASFETNVPAAQSGRQTADMVAQVVDIFKPGRFSVTLFEAKGPEDGPARVKKDKGMDAIKGFRRVDRVVHDLEGYELVFRHFEREDWKGGAPILGERVI